MRVRHLIARPKLLQADTGWRAADMPPRHAPIYLRTRPVRGTWKWRSATAISEDVNFTLVAECNPPRENWKSMLLVQTVSGYSVVGRFEDHSSHPGLHGHAHCDRSGIEQGAGSMDKLARIPATHAHHRRKQAWTDALFWQAARDFFNVIDNPGPLFEGMLH